MRNDIVVPAVLAAALFLVPGGAVALDRWEGDLLEDSAATANFIVPGAKQVHDLEGLAILTDADWIRIPRSNFHSFEARVTASTFLWNVGASCASCPSLDRVDATASVLTPGTSGGAGAVVARWIDTPGGSNDQFLRVLAPTGIGLGSLAGYEVELVQTSLAVPRWNNNATQVTVYLVQNHGTAAVSGNMYFFDANGTLLHTQPFTIPGHGVEVFNTATIPALNGQSGAAIVAHTGAAGTIAGKGVALEPGTGFTFDTPFIRVTN